MTFANLGISESVLRAIADMGYTRPTPIQEQAIPVILMGRDIVGSAQTGTGKTGSFTLPMIDILSQGRARARMPRSLILEPTRELAAQVAENFDMYGKYLKLSKVLLIGGESMADQVKVLERGADVLIATPGRLLDVFDRGHLLMNDVRMLVIDEADRMLDMGFIPDVERIIGLISRNRQTLLFSATMPPAIRRLADTFLINPKEIIIAPPSTPAATVTQGLLVVAADGASGFSTGKEKRAALRAMIRREDVRSALIFCNRKRDVGVLCRSLVRHGFDAAMLHGDMAQSARTEVLDRFKRGEVRMVVCSDVAARGLDISDMSHVFNFDVPSNAEDYVHRIGRTGRAGREGKAFTIALPEDGRDVVAIERLIGHPIPRIEIEGIESAELDVSGGRRRRGRKTTAAEPEKKREKPGKKQPAPQPPAPAARAAPPARDADRPAPRQKGKDEPRERSRKPHRQEPDTPVVGMGDHVPAFMLRVPVIRKKSDES